MKRNFKKKKKEKAEILKQKQLEEAKTKADLEKIMQERIQEKDQEVSNIKIKLKKKK